MSFLDFTLSPRFFSYSQIYILKKKKKLAAAFCEYESLQENGISSYHHHRTSTGHIFYLLA